MIWKYDRLETLTWDEYRYWMLHPLPLGWAIIALPAPEETR